MKKFLYEKNTINFIDENDSKENAILFIHGNSHSLRAFIGQMKSKDLQNYRLLFIDLPGHGESSPIEKYSLKNFARVINALINSLGLKSFVIVGHSLGGHVAINILKMDANPYGIILFGTPPIKAPFDSSGFLPNLKGLVLSKIAPEHQEIIDFLDELKYSGENKNIALEDFLKTDARFRQEIFDDIIKGTHENEVQLIEDFTGHILFLISSEETLINNNYIKQENFIHKSNVSIKEIQSGHSPHIEVSDKFNKVLLEFCRKVFRASQRMVF